jgi:hypothetical protein
MFHLSPLWRLGLLEKKNGVPWENQRPSSGSKNKFNIFKMKKRTDWKNLKGDQNP